MGSMARAFAVNAFAVRRQQKHRLKKLKIYLLKSDAVLFIYCELPSSLYISAKTKHGHAPASRFQPFVIYLYNVGN